MRQLYNKNIFSSQNIAKLTRLNEKLKKEETRIYAFSHRLDALLNKQKKDNLIDNYIIHQEVSLRSNNPECNKRHKVQEGIPFWKDQTFNLFYYNKEDMFYSENWNELVPEHPLGKIEFCYTMHCLCFHSTLSWQDLLDIDDVRIELNVAYQFNTTI